MLSRSIKITNPVGALSKRARAVKNRAYDVGGASILEKKKGILKMQINLGRCLVQTLSIVVLAFIIAFSGCERVQKELVPRDRSHVRRNRVRFDNCGGHPGRQF